MSRHELMLENLIHLWMMRQEQLEHASPISTNEPETSEEAIQLLGLA